MSQQREWTFGTHRAHLESSELLVFRLEGALRLEDARELVHILQQAACHGPVFAVADFSNTFLEPAARGHLAQHVQAQWLQAVVLSGAGLIQRAAVKSILVSLYLTGAWNVPVEFVETEAQSHALIARLRLQQSLRAA